jgi:diguanylate cyclase (GGDEF)-like protein
MVLEFGDMKQKLEYLMPPADRQTRQRAVYPESIQSKSIAINELELRRNYLNQLDGLAKFSQSLGEIKYFDNLIKKILEGFIKTNGANSGSLLLKKENNSGFKLSANKGADNDFTQIICDRLTLLAKISSSDLKGRGLSRHIFNHVFMLSADAWGLGFGNSFVISVPLESAGKLIAMVILNNNINDILSDEEKRILMVMGSQAGTLIENALLLDKMSELCLIDELTRLYNRRHFYQVLEVEVDRAKRFDRPLSLIILDIDKFKEFNDKFGHAGGDGILKSLAEVMRSNLRRTDTCCRFGGDEFAVIMPETNSNKAKEILERVRLKWLSIPKIESGGLENPIGFSVGIAEFPKDATTQNNLLSLADAAVYHSKKCGGYKSTTVSEIGERLPKM